MLRVLTHTYRFKDYSTDSDSKPNPGLPRQPCTPDYSLQQRLADGEAMGFRAETIIVIAAITEDVN